MGKKADKAAESFVASYAAQEHAEKLSAEYDSAENPQKRPELDRKIQKQIQDFSAPKKPKLVHIKRWAVLAGVSLFLLGAVGYEAFNYIIRDNGTNSDFLHNYTQSDLVDNGFYHFPTDLPHRYEITRIHSTEHLRELFFDDGEGNMIVFAESDMEMSQNVDTEHTQLERVIISSGYEAVFIQKNGVTLIWNQSGYFYKLFSTDIKIDLARIASSLEKV